MSKEILDRREDWKIKNEKTETTISSEAVNRGIKLCDFISDAFWNLSEIFARDSCRGLDEVNIEIGDANLACGLIEDAVNDVLKGGCYARWQSAGIAKDQKAKDQKMMKSERVCELLVQYERDGAMPRHFAEKNERMAYHEAIQDQSLRDAILLAQDVVRERKASERLSGDTDVLDEGVIATRLKNDNY